MALMWLIALCEYKLWSGLSLTCEISHGKTCGSSARARACVRVWCRQACVVIETVWGKVTEGPEFPAPFAFAVPGLCLLTMTHMMNDFTCLVHSQGPTRFLLLSPPLFGGSKANSTTNGIDFHFFHGIFERAFYKPLNDISKKKKSLKKKSKYSYSNSLIRI